MNEEDFKNKFPSLYNIFEKNKDLFPLINLYNGMIQAKGLEHYKIISNEHLSTVYVKLYKSILYKSKNVQIIQLNMN